MPRKLKPEIYDPVTRRARSLAKLILKEDFNKLFKTQKYLVFKIKIKKDHTNKIETKRIYMFRNFFIYQYDETLREKKAGKIDGFKTYQDQTKQKFTRICSLIDQPAPRSYASPYYPEEQMYTRDYLPQVCYNKYDTLVAQYLWLKHYTKHPCDFWDFKKSFNILTHDKSCYRDLIKDTGV